MTNRTTLQKCYRDSFSQKENYTRGRYGFIEEEGRALEMVTA
jgi:hypothetical protein